MSDQNDKSLSDKELENVAGGRTRLVGSQAGSTSTSTSTSSSSYTTSRPSAPRPPTGSSYSGSSMG